MSVSEIFFEFWIGCNQTMCYPTICFSTSVSNVASRTRLQKRWPSPTSQLSSCTVKVCQKSRNCSNSYKNIGRRQSPRRDLSDWRSDSSQTKCPRLGSCLWDLHRKWCCCSTRLWPIHRLWALKLLNNKQRRSLLSMATAKMMSEICYPHCCLEDKQMINYSIS